MKPYLALFRNNLRLTLRDRSALFFNYLFPFIFFFAFAEMFHAGTGMGIAYFVGTVLTMGILGNGLWGSGMRAVQEREQNILRRYKVTPITPLPLLLASLVSGWLLYLPVLVVLILAAHFGYAMPFPQNWVSLFLMTSLGVCAFRAIGLILASVTNTMQEANILIQLLYMPMLFLSGTTIPAAILPNWAQTVAEFLPASYLVTGFQGIFFHDQTILDNLVPVGALLLTIAVGLFFAVNLFRWEKEEKLKRGKKLWVIAVLGPFLAMGCYRSYSREHIGQNQAMFRDLERAGTFLIRNTRLIVGDGEVIETGSVLVHDGKIQEVFQGSGPDPTKLKADVVEGAGKTLLPGLIDSHVHLAGTGALTGGGGPGTYAPLRSMLRSDAALLYSGITAARSAGDDLETSLSVRKKIFTGEKQGAELFACGPMFTVEGSLGTEFTRHIPEAARANILPHLIRTPKSPEEARKQVRDLKKAGVDCIKTLLEAGSGSEMRADRMDLLIARSVSEEAHAQNLPLAVHTGDARDVTDAVEIGAASVEHGSWHDQLPDNLLERMVKQGVYLDPTLAVIEAYVQYYSGKSDLLNNSLVQQVVPAEGLKTMLANLSSGKTLDPAQVEFYQNALQQARDNLVRAWKAGVPLVLGTDSGNPLMIRGPSLHRELQLWVDAGIPAWVALQAATGNAAKLLGADKRIGFIRKGLDANLLLVDGNPLIDIAATERISMVIFKGERVRRPDLFDQK